MKGRRSSALGAALRSGRGSVVIGIFYSHPGGAVVFQGLSLPRVSCVLGVGAGRGRRWSLPVSAVRLTVLPVLRPSDS